MFSFYGLVGGLIASGIVVYTNPSNWNFALAAFLALVVSFVNLNSNEVQLPALLTLGFSFFLASNDPKRVLLWSILIPVWIPIGEILRFILNSERTLGPSELLGSFLAFGFSFAGSYLGAKAKNASSKAIKP
jgi:hypothetical protein